MRRKKVCDTKSTSSGHEEVTFSFGVNYFVWCTLEWVNNQQLDCDSVLLARELGFLTPAGSKEVYDPVYPRQTSHLSPHEWVKGAPWMLLSLGISVRGCYLFPLALNQFIFTVTEFKRI